jgi:UDP-N-acetylmuramate--alanine ligase
MFKRYQQIHFVGVGGSGMSGIAEILLNLGYRVTGSDLKRNDAIERLEQLGAKVTAGHEAANVAGAHVVVYSSAVSRDNIEVQVARQRGIPVIPRAEMLAELMRLKYGIAVAGTHGKTTTTSMVGAVLAEARLDPTVVVGGRVASFGSNARLGQGEYLVAEADESDGSFLKLTPTIAVVTTVDAEHLDHYGSLESIREAFTAFVSKVLFYGSAVLCLDQPNIQMLLPRIEKRVITYGLESGADLVARRLRLTGMQSRFEVSHRGAALGECSLAIPGTHNVANALAAIGVGLDLEIPFATIQRALAGFAGVQRRFQILGAVGRITVVDDYGHHPTEIAAVLAAARATLGRRVVVAFQPHRYSRTERLLDAFGPSMRDADEIVLTDIYAASEEPIPGITLDALADAVHAGSGRPVHVVRRLEDVVPEVVKVARPGDVVITLGAGSIGTLPGRLLEALRARGADFAEPGSGDRGPGIGDRTPGQSAEGRDS